VFGTRFLGIHRLEIPFVKLECDVAE
jgi:hypothetical protein